MKAQGGIILEFDERTRDHNGGLHRHRSKEEIVFQFRDATKL